MTRKERRDKRRPLSEFPRQYVGSFDDDPDGWEFLTEEGVARRDLGGEGKPLPLFSGVMGLGGWVVDRYEEFVYARLFVYARCQVVPSACDRCSSDNLIRFGSQTQKFRDLPYHMKPTTLVVERQRLRCKDCGKTQFQMLPHMDAQHMMTERLKKYVRKQAMERTFTSIAEDVGVDEKTVRRAIDRDDLP